MVSDSGTEEEQSTMGEEETQMGEMGGSTEAPREEEEESMPSGTTEAPSMEEAATPSKKKVSGRRAALKIVRENVDRVGKDLTNFRKSTESSTKRLEKQIAQLRTDISALKSHVAKEATRQREKQESLANKILQRLSSLGKSSSSSSKKSSKKVASSKKRKSKGKK
jgi:hypothetical protein